MARVLVVDDEPDMRWVLQEALTKAGHAPHTAGSGSEALALLANTPIDLVILDLKLKGIDGLATLQAMHQRWPEVVVIILTAYGTVATAVTALQSGAADYPLRYYCLNHRQQHGIPADEMQLSRALP